MSSWIGRISTQTLRAALRSSLRTYVVRVQLALVGVLLILLGVTHLPLHPATPALGWQFNDAPRSYRIDLIELPDDPAAASSAASGGAIPTTHREALPEPEPDPLDEAGGGDEALDASEAPDPDLAAMESRSAVLEFSEQMPEIEGGIGSYYLNIQYPRAAIEAGVHGRLILSFVVEQDGRPTQIEVLQSLHPLCDSSAVRALRQTRFVPGRQNGEPVRVRMRLPVHFKIVTPTADQRAEIETPHSG